jgi:threonine/homoserine/homoserine lactone efflux protein
MGFLTAIPIGATQIEIAKRSLNNHLRAAYMVALGSVASDMMYGFIALFGIAPFFKNQMVVAYFGLAATVILWLLAYLTFREASKDNLLELSHSSLKSKRWSFLTGFSIAVTNPMMIIWWLIGARIMKEIGVVSDFNFDTSFLFVVLGGSGLFTYLFTLSNMLHWAKKFISKETLKKIYYFLGVVLIALSFYFLITSIITFIKK